MQKGIHVNVYHIHQSSYFRKLHIYSNSQNIFVTPPVQLTLDSYIMEGRIMLDLKYNTIFYSKVL